MSDRWWIGEESATGTDLILRDKVLTATGVDARVRIVDGLTIDIGTPGTGPVSSP